MPEMANDAAAMLPHSVVIRDAATSLKNAATLCQRTESVGEGYVPTVYKSSCKQDHEE